MIMMSSVNNMLALIKITPYIHKGDTTLTQAIGIVILVGRHIPDSVGYMTANQNDDPNVLQHTTS
jgi:hypothetical protein